MKLSVMILALFSLATGFVHAQNPGEAPPPGTPLSDPGAEYKKAAEEYANKIRNDPAMAERLNSALHGGKPGGHPSMSPQQPPPAAEATPPPPAPVSSGSDKAAERAREEMKKALAESAEELKQEAAAKKSGKKLRHKKEKVPQLQ